ncbi:MAG: hypothetical protein BAJALOKI3v1_50115 [Promethearchaeota archaeon]|nr:MAG: hypothetical protein BAJALOKI3v1_50115 [Candidatus Lokiarchaeota archaeon]
MIEVITALLLIIVFLFAIIAFQFFGWNRNYITRCKLDKNGDVVALAWMNRSWVLVKANNDDILIDSLYSADKFCGSQPQFIRFRNMRQLDFILNVYLPDILNEDEE